MDRDRKTDFDHLLEVWGSELGGIRYHESFNLVDLLPVASTPDTRKLLTEALRRLDAHEEEPERITGG